MGGKVCLSFLNVAWPCQQTFENKRPNNVLPLNLKQTFPSIIQIFTEGEDEGDGIESRIPS